MHAGVPCFAPKQGACADGGSLICRHSASGEHCAYDFVRYHPSPWEISWSKGIAALVSNDPKWPNGCQKIIDEGDYVSQLIASGARECDEIKRYNASVFSEFETVDKCTGEIVMQPIEPLVSFLRNPRAVCEETGDSAILDKDEWLYLHCGTPRKAGRAFLFDLGSSTYATGAGGASQKWFVETYRKRGIHFDDIYSWEVKKYDPVDFWSEVPAEVMQITHFYNVPASTNPSAPTNPIRMLKSIVREHDFVVVKVDIDNTAVEEEFIRQIISSEIVMKLIDEIFWEHHVRGSPMQHYGWGDLTTQNSSLTDTYELLETMRKHGVRAHSWV